MPKYLTLEGFEKLKKELYHLKTVERKKLAKRLKLAISFGDLSENFAYKEAKESQGFLEGKISELQQTIASAEIIKRQSKSKFVIMGSMVTVGPDKEKFQIVGAEESNPLKNKISYSSPIGKALLGKTINEKVEIKTPQGKIEYIILKIE
ncbi:MAG: transcription elongation factor GreA [Patescibacteria group bacterium]|nr:transcription elongation factor GreA [Patescibacteria group bacterium]